MKISELKTKKRLDFYLGNALLLSLRPLTALGRALFHRDHASRPRGPIVALKLLGGGSLVIAFPALLGLRRRFPETPMTLVTTSAVAPFAELLGVFDRVLAIDDRSFLRFIASGLAALARCFRADTVIDLEVYSRFSTVFSVLTCARNRIGFFLDDISWRKHFNSHLVYFNRHGPAHFFYEELVRWLGAAPADMADCRATLMRRLPPVARPAERPLRLALGHACSDLGAERMLSPEQWRRFMAGRLPDGVRIEVLLLGGPQDRSGADRIAAALAPDFPRAAFLNRCGQFSLAHSVAELAACDAFYGIDSSLLHFARLLGIKSASCWGPTSPAVLLKPVPGLAEEVLYEGVPCSPCIHVTEAPPCRGRNLCVEKIFDKSVDLQGKDALFTAWAAGGRHEKK